MKELVLRLDWVLLILSWTELVIKLRTKLKMLLVKKSDEELQTELNHLLSNIMVDKKILTKVNYATYALRTEF